jgi:hypothetical protein
VYEISGRLIFIEQRVQKQERDSTYKTRNSTKNNTKSQNTQNRKQEYKTNTKRILKKLSGVIIQ